MSVQNKIGHKVKETRRQPGLSAILTGSTCTMGLFLGQLVRNFVIANEKSDSVFQNSPIMQFDRATSKWPILWQYHRAGWVLACSVCCIDIILFLLLFRHVRSVGGLKKIVAIAKSRDRYSPKIVKTANQVCLSPVIFNNNEYDEKLSFNYTDYYMTILG